MSCDVAYDVSATEDDVSLLTPEQKQQQQEWDEELIRRQRDLERQQLQSRERRRQVSAKMSHLQSRWQGIERRRVLRSRQGSATGQTPLPVTAVTSPCPTSQSQAANQDPGADNAEHAGR